MAKSRTSLVPRVGRAILVVAVASALAAAPAASSTPVGASSAAPVSDGAVTMAAAFTLTLTPFKSGFASPVFMTAAHDGSGRLFVAEQGGRVKVISRDGTVLPTPLLDISKRVSKGTEQGLLGLAFHPNFKTNGKFYVDFTNLAGDTAINEYRLSPPSSNRVTLPGRRILTIDQPYVNHNGGDIAFGPDGFLYIGMGDGGSAGDPGNRAQSRNTLLGKILRINVNGHTATRGYLIPSSNPYVGRAGRDEIWSYGLRNPWRFSIDPATGALWIGDVGQNRFEEVDRSLRGIYKVGGRGRNYGWRVLEGRHCFIPATGCSRVGKTMPLIEYAHDNPNTTDDNCAVTGGYVYRGNAYPLLRGQYVYGDFCSGRIWTISAGASPLVKPTLRLDTSLAISSFALNGGGELYVLSLDGGIYRVGATP
jgi:glucose/arabinose dehydrogenase